MFADLKDPVILLIALVLLAPLAELSASHNLPDVLKFEISGTMAYNDWN